MAYLYIFHKLVDNSAIHFGHYPIFQRHLDHKIPIQTISEDKVLHSSRNQEVREATVVI